MKYTLPAFPQNAASSAPNDTGMTLRDYFAGQALAGFSVAQENSGPEEKWDWDTLATTAYIAADAMMKARAK